ncbi:general substrate transporter [Aaosphaeria arxii CBS 175.79]|uniref:General substrate transporter n=1 Tax=Aaosphaeria arxii CBS 175.79 TaxID=1450172 RepID=A0A6A5XBV6_9PLEO|nr:general substrate transporter [Aaosphaeria arxii CBS 175.79]KAF2010390.1 general substrate transporter [Aaosphaeria arxii CBS 175.79]
MKAIDTDAVKGSQEYHEHAVAPEQGSIKKFEIESSTSEQTVWQELKSNHRVVAYAFLANAGSLTFGFDILVTGAITALPSFSMSFGEQYKGQLILPALWQGLWTAFIQIGIMMGAAFNGPFQDKFGRRLAFALGGVATALGTAMAFTSPDLKTLVARRVLFLFSKIVTGMGMGILMTTCQTYISDISPVKLRGALLAFFPFMTSVGQMIAITIVFSRIMVLDISSFKVPFATQWAFSGLALLAALILPESPVILVSQDKTEAAQKSYSRLHGSTSDVALALTQIRAVLDHEKELDASSGNSSFSECFQGVNRRRTFIIIIVALLQYFLGVSILANANYFLIMAGMSPTQSLQMSQIGVGVSMVTIAIAFVTITKFGRRTIVLWSSIAAATVFVAMGIAGCFPDNKSATRFVGASIIASGAVTNLGVGATWPVLISELSSVRLRAKSSAIGFITNAFAGVVFSISVPYMFNVDAGNLGGKIGFIFAALSILSFVLSFLFVPETKARSFEELDILFERRVSARRFATTLI